MPIDERPTVYSTDPDFEKRCPHCNHYPCRCTKRISLPPDQQVVGIKRERKGRGGKTVTIVSDIQLNNSDMKDLAKMLKQLCGSGGTIKDNQIEIQGDHRDKITDKLRRMGYKVKYIGG